MPYSDQDRQREFQRNWMAGRRKELLAALGGKCVVCGATEGLEFHHVDPSQKEGPVNGMLSWRRARVLPELSKCELRCTAHHDEAHPANHGWTLWRRGCRCGVCVAAGEEAKRKDRELKRLKRKTNPLYGRSVGVA